MADDNLAVPPDADLIAHLEVQNIDMFPPDTRKGLCIWLRETADTLEKNPNRYHNKYSYKYYTSL